MKTTKLLKTVLLVLAVMGGGKTAWADGTISIPQDIGSYIVIGTATGGTATSDGVTITNCKVDAQLGDATNSRYYSVGSTGSSTTVSIAVEATGETADYVFGFKTGAENCTAELSLRLVNSSSVEEWNGTASVVNTGSWTPTTNQLFKITGLAAGTYTMTISVASNTGSYAGNWGNFYFHSLSQLAMPTSSASYLELSDGTFSNARDNSDNVVNYIYDGGYISDLVVYNSSVGYYSFNFNIDSYQNYDDSQVSITIADFGSNATEYNQTISITKGGDYALPIAGQLTAGLKKVRIGFSSAKALADGNHHLFNFRQVYFPSFSYDGLPLTGTSTLNLNQATVTFANCGYESGEGKNNIGNVRGASPSANNYYVLNTNETAYYDIYANIPWYKSETQLKVTVTDLATNTEEATATSSSITSAAGVIHFALNNAITPGTKRIRLDFISETTSEYLINVKEVSFYKRSLNENYDYTPVAATGMDVVLTRSITGGNWSTICLPFAMTAEQITATFGEGTVVSELTESDSESLTFATRTAMEANKPYLIKTTANVSGEKTISGVTIVSATPSYSVSDEKATFTGVYTNGNVPSGSYVLTNNTLYKLTDNKATIKPFRAYFTVPGAAGARLGVKFDEEETTALLPVGMNEFVEAAHGSVYTLQGVRVSQPRRGLYVVNGKKVVIR